MKTPKNAPLPAVAFSIVEHEVTGNRIVTFAAPSRCAALLPEHAGIHVIQSACVVPEVIRARTRIWRTGKIERGRETTTGPENLAMAMDEGCDALISTVISAVQWDAMQQLCAELGISPGQYLLSAAIYSAAIEESEIDAALVSAGGDSNPQP